MCGTDNHLLVIDTMASFGLDGRAAEEALDAIGVTANKQIVPDDPRPPLRPSGLRLGTPACTTRGMSEEDMTTIAQWIGDDSGRWFFRRSCLRQPDDPDGSYTPPFYRVDLTRSQRGRRVAAIFTQRTAGVDAPTIGTLAGAGGHHGSCTGHGRK